MFTPVDAVRFRNSVRMTAGGSPTELFWVSNESGHHNITADYVRQVVMIRATPGVGLRTGFRCEVPFSNVLFMNVTE